MAFFITISTQFSVLAQDHHEEAGEFKPSELLLDHIKDSHDWHIADMPGGHPVSLPLPWILYNSEKGLDVFMLHGHSHAELEHSANEKGYKFDHGNIVSQNANATVIDFSITKTALQMFIIGFIMLLVIGSVAKKYKNNPNAVPSGIQSFLEPIIIFVRDDVVKPNIGKKYEAFLPYMLHLFFFIWFSNLMGLLPINSNIAGNISVTCALAILTFIITNVNGNGHYWGHIFWFPGVPLWVKPIMTAVEVVGLFTKPFALTIRLFANIAAGHFMVLSLISLIFILGKNGTSMGGALSIAPMSIAFSLFILCLELLVALVQAYVFTLLSCVFIGAAMEDHGHHEEAHH